MEVNKENGALVLALSEQGFRAIGEFDFFVTFARDGDPVKIHVAPDGSFAAFNDDDELLSEGEGAKDFCRTFVDCQGRWLGHSPSGELAKTKVMSKLNRKAKGKAPTKKAEAVVGPKRLRQR